MSDGEKTFSLRWWHIAIVILVITVAFLGGMVINGKVDNNTDTYSQSESEETYDIVTDNVDKIYDNILEMNHLLMNPKDDKAWSMKLDFLKSTTETYTQQISDYKGSLPSGVSKSDHKTIVKSVNNINKNIKILPDLYSEGKINKAIKVSDEILGDINNINEITLR